MEAIRNYVEALFASLPQNADTQRIKDDMLANLEEKYQALLAEGKNPAEVTGIIIASIGSAEELRKELGLDAVTARQRYARSRCCAGIRPLSDAQIRYDRCRGCAVHPCAVHRVLF